MCPIRSAIIGRVASITGRDFSESMRDVCLSFLDFSDMVLIGAASSRKHEFEADAFAAAHSSAAHLVSALVKLHEDNANTLTPDALYVRFYYSHPPASERISHLEQLQENAT